MSSTKGHNDPPSNELKSSEKSSTLTELDLDKNPIRYANHDGTLSENAHDKEYMELTLRSGNHSDLARKILRQRIESRAKEFPRWPAEATSGARLMWLESRFYYDRERLGPDFDDDWRTYRAKFLSHLALDPREPRRLKEYDHALINPVRRSYMKIGDFIENQIIQRFFTKDHHKSTTYRWLTTRCLMSYLCLIGGYYYLLYGENNWMCKGGHITMMTRPVIHTNHPHYPFIDYKTKQNHFWQNGFPRRTIFKDLRDFDDSTVVL